MGTFQKPKWVHTTLPSVESWGQNMNILRDPPRSITTRRIDKTLLTSSINELIDSSTDRACESIRVYARGINPMQSVVYDNNSNNAGVGSNNILAGGKQSFLPYRIMVDGAFRPPVRGPRELLPLSRLPRVWCNVMSKPGFADYSKSKHCPTKFRVIKDLLNAYDVKPNKSCKLEKPIQENFEMRDSINDKHIDIEANAGTSSCGMEMSDYTRDNIDMYKGVGEVIEAWADTNPSQYRSQNLSDLSINEKQYTHDFLNYQAGTNNSIAGSQGLNGMSIQKDRFIQDAMQYEKKSGYNPGYTLIGEMADPELDRNFPVYQMTSSKSDSRVNKRIEYENELNFSRNLPQTSVKANVTKIDDFSAMNSSSRDFKLIPKIVAGSFENSGVRPTFDRAEQQFKSGSSDKDKMRNFFNEQQFGRW